MKAMLLAAGRGKRLSPLTDDTPKSLLKIGSKSIIEYQLENLSKAGITEIVINICYLAKQFIDALGDGSRYGVNIHYSYEPEESGLETGGGIYQALPLLGDDAFIVISSDIFTDFDYSTLPNKLNGLAHLILADNPPYHPNGDFCLINGKVKTTGAPLLNYAGISVLSPDLFTNCKPGKFRLGPLLVDAANNDQVTGAYHAGHWANVSSIKQLQQLQATYDK